MFKKIFFVFAILSLFLFSGVSALAQEDQNKWWDFEKWAVDININKDSTFVVRETQTFNFYGNYHWVKRDIAKNKLRAISDVKVFDEDGRELAPPEVEVIEDAAQVSVKLNFDLTDTQKTWTFEYKVHGGLGYFEDHDELYWNAVSSERDVPIGSVEVLVHLPEEVPIAQLKQTLYTGPAGNTTPSETSQVVDGKTFKFWGSDIGSYENFTIVAGWPKGIVFAPGILKVNSDPAAAVIVDGKKAGLGTPAVLEENYEISSGEHKISVAKFGWNIKGEKEKIVEVGAGKVTTLDFELNKALWFVVLDELSYLIPILVAVFLFRKYKSIPKLKKTIIAQYEPPANLSPAEVGGLVHSSVSSKDFTATLVDLAYRGYLKIVEREEKVLWSKVKKYTLIKRKPFTGDAALLEHEAKFLEAIFGMTAESVEVSDLKDKSAFREAIMDLPKEIIKKMVGENGCFSSVPMPKATGCFLGAILVFFGLSLAPFIIFLTSGFAIGKALILSASLAILYLIVKPPPYTAKGLEAKWHALGFKEYLQVAERFRLGACTPETFEQYLSYAMVFGVEKKWADRFADIYKTQPDWYEGSQPISGFNSVIFASALSGMSASVTSAISYSSPSGSSGFGGGGGGGSSGGGGGGGGSSAG
jgi:uncharacterized membrane protein